MIDKETRRHWDTSLHLLQEQAEQMKADDIVASISDTRQEIGACEDENDAREIFAQARQRYLFEIDQRMKMNAVRARGVIKDGDVNDSDE